MITFYLFRLTFTFILYSYTRLALNLVVFAKLQIYLFHIMYISSTTNSPIKSTQFSTIFFNVSFFHLLLNDSFIIIYNFHILFSNIHLYMYINEIPL